MIKKRVSVIGLGHIGFPLASLLAASNYSVVGVDIDPDALKRAKDADFDVSTETTVADIHIVTVPTPCLNQKPDLSCVYNAIDALKPKLRSEDLVLIESTCPIGTTEALAKEVKAHLAYCPERTFPGNLKYELIHNDRIVGGINDVSTALACEFYRSFTQGEVMATDARTAEAVKLAENAYRDINIAYANELSMIAEQIGVDVNEWIRLANSHPRVNILNPGPGVGGHCIAVDPWFLVAAAPSVSTLTKTAREVNTKKTAWVVQKIREAMKKNAIQKVACLGLTYKPNVNDLRQSPALEVVEAIKKDVTVFCVDPYVSSVDWRKACHQAEMIVGLVAHDLFREISTADLRGKVVLDFGGVF